ncbi:MAG: SDR family NAD(P)-dependent oxidoreductase, partial [Acidobacteriota bacterium]|nr:SDR family NAD(P)-dependent oxidoreductase [Acidobacteriota bacterium]
MFRLDGKTIAVIGAGSGIGQAVALGVAQQGGHTICLDLNAASAAATAEMIAKAGGSADSGVLDIADEASVRDALANSLH